MGIFLERALRTAFTQASAWVLVEPELRRLLALCSSGKCRACVEERLRDAQSPKPAEIVPFLNEVRIKVAQYIVDRGERSSGEARSVSDGDGVSHSRDEIGRLEASPVPRRGCDSRGRTGIVP